MHSFKTLKLFKYNMTITMGVELFEWTRRYGSVEVTQ